MHGIDGDCIAPLTLLTLPLAPLLSAAAQVAPAHPVLNEVNRFG